MFRDANKSGSNFVVVLGDRSKIFPLFSGCGTTARLTGNPRTIIDEEDIKKGARRAGCRQIDKFSKLFCRKGRLSHDDEDSCGHVGGGVRDSVWSDLNSDSRF